MGLGNGGQMGGGGEGGGGGVVTGDSRGAHFFDV